MDLGELVISRATVRVALPNERVIAVELHPGYDGDQAVGWTRRSSRAYLPAPGWARAWRDDALGHRGGDDLAHCALQSST